MDYMSWFDVFCCAAPLPPLLVSIRTLCVTNLRAQSSHTVFLFAVSVQIVLTEMYFDGFHRSFCDDDEDLEIIQESDSIFAFETPELFRPEQIRSKRGGTLFFISLP